MKIKEILSGLGILGAWAVISVIITFAAGIIMEIDYSIHGEHSEAAFHIRDMNFWLGWTGIEFSIWSVAILEGLIVFVVGYLVYVYFYKIR